MAWVIDGATNLDAVAVTPLHDDAAWLADQLDTALHSPEFHSTVPLADLLRDVCRRIAAQYHQFETDRGLSAPIMPSAGLAVIRWDAFGVDYLLLGDCSLSVVSLDKRECKTIHETQLGRLDRIALGRLAAFREQGLSLEAAQKAIVPLLRQHRQMMNQDHGYWVFSLDPEALDHAITGRIDLASSTAFLLASDGFSRLWDTLEVYPSCWEVYQDIEHSGLTAVVDTLRTVENSDLDLVRWPRFKKSDDASATVVTFEKPASPLTS